MNLPVGVRLSVHDAAAAAKRFPAVRDLYRSVFAEPPHSEGEREFYLFETRWWPTQLQQPGFRLVLAEHPEHGQVGATYGHRLAADTTWWDGALNPIPEAEHPGRTVAIIEMMVLRPWRRLGVATTMHEQFLAGHDEERATLLVRPDNDSARTAYKRWGYRKVGQIRPSRSAPVYDAMLLDRM